MRLRRSFPLFCSLSLLVGASLNAAAIHPVEQRLRDSFPGVPLQTSAAGFEAADEIVGTNLVPVLRARFPQQQTEMRTDDRLPSHGLNRAEAELHVSWPRFYTEPLVAVLGDQRVVLRPINARGALAEAANGKLVYQEPYGSVDAIELPSKARSEELLLLRDERAQLVFDYEIVDTSGVGAIVMDRGAIRFMPKAIPSAADMTAARFIQPARMLQIDRPWVVDSAGRRSTANARWELIGDDSLPKTVRLIVSAEGLKYPLLVDPTFSVTGSLASARSGHTATLLNDGTVLIAGGGDNNGNIWSSAEIYDPATGAFTPTGSLVIARENHTATLLANGTVLIAGGYNSTGTGSGAGSTRSAEIYDPTTARFTTTGALVTERRNHIAVLLPSGLVLVAGGNSNAAGSASIQASAELYDPTAHTFSATGSMNTQRSTAAAALLPNGKVLVVGGGNYNGYLATAEIFDPLAAGAGSFTLLNSTLSVARADHSATLMRTGKVLIAGGYANSYPTLAELFDPAANGGLGGFSSTASTVSGHKFHTAALLPNGKVLIAGGADSNTTYTTVAELFDPAGNAGAGSFTTTAPLSTARGYDTATLLPSGRVLVTGGFQTTGGGAVGITLSSAELYDSANGTFAATSSNLTDARYKHSATLMSNGDVLVAGGFNSVTGTLNSAEIFDTATGFSTTGNLTFARNSHTATLLPDGTVLIAGGAGLSGYLQSGEIFTGTTFTPTPGVMAVGRSEHTATLLANGKVLMAGGIGSTGALTSCELYDPSAKTFGNTGVLFAGRYDHTATLLPTGQVLIAGGYNGNPLNSAELYDPATGTFSHTGNMLSPRYQHTATLLPNGKVLIAGGIGPGTGIPALSSAELYDPLSGTFSATGSMSYARYEHSATLLQNGSALIAAGHGASSPPWSTAELYDPQSGTFGLTGNLPSTRAYQTATMLLNGQVLIAAGYNGAYLSTAALYDPGVGFIDGWRPVVTGVSFPVAQPANLTVSGSGFRGGSEASGGASNSSPTDYPILQLQRVDNDQTLFLEASSWSDTGFRSNVLRFLANGPYRETVVTNGIPSLQRIVVFSGVVAPMAPAFIFATATSVSTVELTWGRVDEAVGYDVFRTTSINVPFALVLSTKATTAIDSGLSNDTTYLYEVRALGSGGPSPFTAIDPATTTVFVDSNLNGVTIKAVHFTQLRTAVNAMRVAAALQPATWTNAIAPGAIVYATDLTELRARLDEARSALLLSAVNYTDQSITPASTAIKAAHVLDIRAGTQ